MAVEWTKQAEDMIKTWTGAQQKMWESWVSAVQGIGTPSAGASWEKTIDTWQESVKGALDAQITWTKFWAESVAASAGSSQQMTDWSKQILEMAEKWTSTQDQLWSNWFDTMKKSDPVNMSKNWNPEEMQKMMQVWQESAQKAMEAQMEMARMWTTQPTTSK